MVVFCDYNLGFLLQIVSDQFDYPQRNAHEVNNTFPNDIYFQNKYFQFLKKNLEWCGRIWSESDYWPGILNHGSLCSFYWVVLYWILSSRRQFLWTKPTNCKMIEFPGEKKKNLIFVKGLLALGDEIRGLKAKLAGLDGSVEHREPAVRSWLQPRTAVSWRGWVSPLLGE